MFLTGRGWYGVDGQQKAEGLFLLIFGGKGEQVIVEETGRYKAVDFPLKACVRHVRMSQLGHFMMARVKIGTRTISLSGTYGHDGLPLSVDAMDSWKRWESLIQLPAELEREFWQGGGHNSGGSEMTNMSRWAKENLQQLRKAGGGR